MEYTYTYTLSHQSFVSKQKFLVLNGRIRNFWTVARLFSRFIRQMHSTARIVRRKIDIQGMISPSFSLLYFNALFNDINGPRS